MDEENDKINAKIRELRLKQKQAIEVLDFTYARQINEEIIEIKAGNAKKNKQSLYQPYLDMLEKYLIEFSDIVAEKKRLFFNEEKCIRAKYEQKFKQAKNRHMKILAEIQMKQVKSFLKERSRPVPEYEDMIINAKKAAAAGDFDLAEQIRDKSSEVAQLVYDEREKKVNDKFQIIQINTLNTMGTEIQNISTLLQRALANVQTKKNACFEDLNKTRELQVIAIHQKFTFAWTKCNPVAKKCAKVGYFNVQFEEICNKYDCLIPDQLLVGDKRIGPQLTQKTLLNRELNSLTPKKRSPSTPTRSRSSKYMSMTPSPTAKRR